MGGSSSFIVANSEKMEDQQHAVPLICNSVNVEGIVLRWLIMLCVCDIFMCWDVEEDDDVAIYV